MDVQGAIHRPATSPDSHPAIRASNSKSRCSIPGTRNQKCMHEYAGLGLTAATPNEAELETAHHETVGTSSSRLQTLGQQTLTRMGLGALIVTRGRDGMMVFERGGVAHSLAVFGSDQAVDVTGAGDTVIAVLTLALAVGATPLEAAQLANYAGGIVVMKRGTATVTRVELSEAIRVEATGQSGGTKG